MEGELKTWKFSDIPQAIKAILPNYRPYEGGNLPLWQLNQLRNPNTHRIIVPVAVIGGTRKMALRHLTINRGSAQVFYSRWNPATNELEFMRLPPDSDFHGEIEFSANIAFANIKSLTGDRVIATLTTMASEVERIVLDIESHCSKIIGSAN